MIYILCITCANAGEPMSRPADKDVASGPQDLSPVDRSRDEDSIKCVCGSKGNW